MDLAPESRPGDERDRRDHSQRARARVGPGRQPFRGDQEHLDLEGAQGGDEHHSRLASEDPLKSR